MTWENSRQKSLAKNDIKTQKKTKSGHVVIGIHFILNDLSQRKIPPCFVRNDRRVLGGELPMDPR